MEDKVLTFLLHDLKTVLDRIEKVSTKNQQVEIIHKEKTKLTNEANKKIRQIALECIGSHDLWRQVLDFTRSLSYKDADAMRCAQVLRSEAIKFLRA